jgi:hypothetical protein
MSDHDNKQEPDVVVGTDLTVAEVELAQDTKRDKKILFKIDIVVLTLVTLVATLEFLDKNGMAYAAVWGRTPISLVSSIHG